MKNPIHPPGSGKLERFLFSSLGAAGGLLSATLLVFGEFLDPATPRMLSKVTEDLATQIAWWRKFGFDELKHGHLALWNPHLFCGAPFFGELQPALLYPLNWPFMVLPLPFAVNLFLALHVFLAGWFTFLWIRHGGFHAASALLAALMVMFGASLFLRIVPGHLLNIGAMPWIPLLLLAIDGFQEDGRKRWMALGLFAVGLQILSAQFQLCYYTGLFALVYALGTAGKRGKLALLAGFFGMMIGGALLGSVQVLAAWDTLGESLRGAGMSIHTADSASIMPERLCCLLLPDFFGSWKDYWGPGFYWEGVVFVSVTAFVLLLLGLGASKNPQKAFFGWSALLLVMLGMGLRTPLFYLFFHCVPYFNHFRGVGKVDIFITLCLAALAAMGMEEAVLRPEKLKRLVKGALWASAAMAAVLGIFKSIELAKGRLYVKYAAHAAGMESSLLIAMLLLGAVALLSRISQKHPGFRYGFLALAFLELVFFARENRPWFDFGELLVKISPIQEIYRQDPGDYRVLAGSESYCLGTGGSDIWGYDTNIPLRYARFQARTQHRDQADGFSGEFKLSEFPDILGLIRLRYVFEERDGRWVPRRLNLKESPRVFWAHRWEILKEDEILQQVTAPGFQSEGKALLESDPGIPMTDGKVGGEARLQDVSSDEIWIDARLSKPALLVMTDNYSRGWKAIPRGPCPQSAYEVMPVYGFLRALPLAAGDHHILLQYRPTAFVVGKWVSIISWTFFLCFLAWEGLRKKSRAPKETPGAATSG